MEMFYNFMSNFQLVEVYMCVCFRNIYYNVCLMGSFEYVIDFIPKKEPENILLTRF